MAPSKGLESSIWASQTRPNRHPYGLRPRPSLPQLPRNPTPPTRTSEPRAPMTPALAFHRFEKAYQRLRWKYIDLENSYKRALCAPSWGFSMEDGERNFKVDFYEFYAWIEQTLVLALLIFGVVVQRDKLDANGLGGPKGMAAHAYHHNVLRALDDRDSPLHGVLGTGDVNHALWKAKELRNRWKDAAEGRETPPLKMYDLTWIVTTILGGLDAAYALAREEAGVIGTDTAMDVIDGADEWEWMVEMDWEP